MASDDLSSFVKKVRERLLQCAVCFSTYEDPRMLDCQHNFCYGCVKGCIKKNTKSLSCPICRYRTHFDKKLADDIEISFVIRSLIELVDSTDKTTVLKKDVPGTSKVTAAVKKIEKVKGRGKKTVAKSKRAEETSSDELSTVARDKLRKKKQLCPPKKPKPAAAAPKVRGNVAKEKLLKLKAAQKSSKTTKSIYTGSQAAKLVAKSFKHRGGHITGAMEMDKTNSSEYTDGYDSESTSCSDEDDDEYTYDEYNTTFTDYGDDSPLTSERAVEKLRCECCRRKERRICHD